MMSDSGQWMRAADDSPPPSASRCDGIDRLIEIRDSQNPDGPKVLYTPREFAAWLGDVENREFDAGVGDTQGSTCRSEHNRR
jgi:uncharacterized protein DUF397